MEATIFNIQSLCVQDGPGIRTTVFFKGCPLRCKWCFNPESHDLKPVLTYHKNLCIHCNRCVDKCKNDALKFNDDGFLVWNKDKCQHCNACVNACNQKNIKFYGQKYTVEEVVNIVKKDKMFFDSTGGGVTLSGGEILLHHEFVCELLDRLREEGISTLIETTGYGPYEHLKQIASRADIVYYDLKHMSDDMHQKYTGVSNKLILENLEKLKEVNTRVVVRIPVIPTVNDKDNVIETGKYIKSLGFVERMGLLPYERFGISKYDSMNINYELRDIKSPSKEEMNEYKTKLEQLGLEVEIGI